MLDWRSNYQREEFSRRFTDQLKTTTQVVSVIACEH